MSQEVKRYAWNPDGMHELSVYPSLNPVIYVLDIYYAAAISARDAEQRHRDAMDALANAFSDEALTALAGARIVTPEQGYIKGFPQGGGPGQLGADIRRLASERDTARAELDAKCELIQAAEYTIDQQCVEIVAARAAVERLEKDAAADRKSANSAINEMKHVWNAERQELVAEVERLRQHGGLQPDEIKMINQQAAEIAGLKADLAEALIERDKLGNRLEEAADDLRDAKAELALGETFDRSNRSENE